jgi:hypothetical protein
MLSRVVDEAQHAYRRRFLQEKYGLVDPLEATATMPDEVDVIRVADIVDAEIEADVDEM